MYCYIFARFFYEMRSIMYYFAGYLTKFILSIFGRLKVHQKEKLPDSGGYVIACTHTGWVDILILGHSILPLKIHYMAKIELFQNRPLKWLMESLNAFPVNRENPGPRSEERRVGKECRNRGAPQH